MKKTSEDIFDKSIFLRVIRYGMLKPEGFTHNELIKDLNLKGWEKQIVSKYFKYSVKNAERATSMGESADLETPFFLIHGGGSQFDDDLKKHITSMSAHFNYLDFEELKFARENAQEARKLAIWAIFVSAAAIIIPLFIELIRFLRS